MIEKRLLTRSESAKRLYGSRNQLVNPGNLSSMIHRTDKEEIITKCRKQTNPRMYQSFSFRNNEDFNTYNIPKEKRMLKFNFF